MTDVNHVIEAIDHALEDYGTSDDAMRWTPEPRPKVSYSVVYTQRDGTETSWSIGDEGISFTVNLDEEIVPSYLDVVQRAVQEMAAASGTPRVYYDSFWEAWRPADHTEHVHINVHDERIPIESYPIPEPDDGP